RALGVVREHHGAGLLHGGFGIADDRRLACRARRRSGLPIGPYQMGRVMLGDEAHLARRLPRLVDHKVGNDQSVELAERIGQRQARLIVADQADQNALRATWPPPPIWITLCLTASTAVGASGEMRVTSP